MNVVPPHQFYSAPSSIFILGFHVVACTYIVFLNDVAFPTFYISLLDFKATLDKSGVLSVRSGDEEPIWETPYNMEAASKEKAAAQDVIVPISAVVVEGGLEVRVGDKVTWSSLHN